MSQPEIVARMIAGKDLVAVGRAISSGIRSNKDEMARRKRFGKEYGGKNGGWKRYDTSMATSAENVLLAIFPEAVHNFKIATGQSAKLGRVHYYKIDLAWPKLKLGVEVDGSYHALPVQARKDSAKDEYLNAKGWTILRFPNRSVLRDIASVKTTINSALRHARSSTVNI